MMMENNRNYDIKRRTYYFSINIIKFLNELSKDYIHQTIGKQLLRSATSIGANIIEAQAGSSKRDFQNFMSHALKSANETKYWLCILRDALNLNNNQIIELLNEIDEICKILGASILKIKRRR